MPAIPFAAIARAAAAELQIADIQNFNDVSVFQKPFHRLERSMGIAVMPWTSVQN